MTCVRCCPPDPGGPDEQAATLDAATRHPALDAVEVIVVVFDQQGRITGTNVYDDWARLMAALDSLHPGEYAEVHAPTPISAIDAQETVTYMAGPDGVPHIRDDERTEGDDVDGYTVCGAAMRLGERWLPTPTAPKRETLCRVCGETVFGGNPCP